MIAAVNDNRRLFSDLQSSSRRLVLRREGAKTTYGGVCAEIGSRLRLRMAVCCAAMSGEARAIWTMSGIATLGFVVLVFGGGTL